MYEQFVRGQASEVRNHFTHNEPRGEFVLVVAGQREADKERWTDEQVLNVVEDELQSGRKAKEISTRLAEKSGWSKKEIYALVTRTNK